MKKCLILLLCLFTTDSFASGIASNSASAPCTNTTLETYSGNSNLSADWQPNEIQLRWYNNNTLMDVQSSANTCVYDGTLSVPQTAPTRTGYTFAGWQVRPEMDFSTLPTNEMGIEGYGIQSGYHVCYNASGKAEGEACKTENFIDGFDDLNDGEWKVVFSWGTLYGMSMCSSTLGTWGTTGTPTEQVNGLYCWCRTTGYVPNNTTTRFAPQKPGWTFNSDCSNNIHGSICYAVCAGRCALYVTKWQFDRSLLMGLLGAQ